MALTSSASLGLPRNGRYATRSMVQFNAPQKIAALISNVITAAVPPMPDHASMPNAPTNVSAKNDPSVHKSPCAKLISSIIPYTMVYPMAISAMIMPLETPVISC